MGSVEPESSLKNDTWEKEKKKRRESKRSINLGLSEISRTEYIPDARMWKEDIPARYLRNREAPLELPLYGHKGNLADTTET